MKIRLFTIPNLLTLANLLCGAVAIVAALVWGDLTLAFALVVLAAVFDFFDGFVARLLHQSSPIGLQLDSLADDISFGVAPAAVMYALYARMPGYWLPDGSVALVVFLYAAFGALRLARFNIDDTQRSEFLGLPIPAAAMLCASLGLLTEQYGMHFSRESLVLVALGAAWLMVSDLRMFALKFHGFGWAGNELRYGFLAVSAVLLLLLGGRAIPLIVVLYVLVSAVRHFAAPATDCRKEE